MSGIRLRLTPAIGDNVVMVRLITRVSGVRDTTKAYPSYRG